MPFTLALASKWACAGGGGLALWCWWVVGTVVQRKGGLWLSSKEECCRYKGPALPESREALGGWRRLGGGRRIGGGRGSGPVGSTFLPGAKVEARN